MYVEYAFGWTELSGLLYMLMIMEVCVCISRAEAAEMYGNRRIKFQTIKLTDLIQYYYNRLSVYSLCDCSL